MQSVSRSKLGLWLALSLLIGLAAPFISPKNSGFWLGELFWWSLAAGLMVWVLGVEKRPLATFGLRRMNGCSVLLGLGVALLTIVCTALVGKFLFPLLGLPFDNQSALQEVTDLPFALQALLALRAGVVEELIYRGYMLGRGSELLPNQWWAFALSVAVFTFAHLASWGAAHLILVAIAATFLGLLFIWRRDLGCNMVAHGLTDFLLFALAAVRPH